MQIVRKKLAPDQVTPGTIRYDADCNCVQQTPDGGVTWNDAPGQDPRSSAAFRAPANSSDQPQCNAAANMVSALQQMVAADISAGNAASLATLLLGTALLFVPVAGWIADAFLLVADAVILLNQATIEAAFTPTVFSDLLCTFFCNIDPDGQMSDDQLTRFLSDVFDNYDFTVWSVITNHSDTLGAVGWSNMGALGTGTGSDCSECDCGPWCYTWDFTLSDGGFTAVNLGGGARGTYVPGSGWHSVSLGTGFTAATIYSPTCGGVCDADVATWSTVMEYSGAAGNGYNQNWFLLDSAFEGIAYLELDGVPTYPGYGAVDGTNTYTYTESAPTDYPNLGISGVINDDAALVIIKSFTVTGNGTMPAFTGGAVCS